MDWQNDYEWKIFKKRWYDWSNIDLNLYRQTQMYRRVKFFLASNGIGNYDEFFNCLTDDKVLYNKFMDHLTINVTEFFRTPESFAELGNVIVSIWKRQKYQNSLKIWSAGCSMGAEPYSVAMILDDCDLNFDYRILATDIDEQMLTKARIGGPYTVNEVKNIPVNFLEKYFISTDKGYVVVDKIREKVTFKKHNLLQDDFAGIFNLILCRNVLIYFVEEAKVALYKSFLHSLKTDGILFLGGTETINNSKAIGYKPIRPFYYQKI